MIVTKTTDLFNNTYNIKVCNQSDIENHFLLISKFIPESEHEEFKVRMFECTEMGTAFALEDDSCFLYYINYKPCCAYGIALFGKGVPIKMLALFIGVFNSIDTRTFEIDFILLEGNLISEYKSILTITSIKRYEPIEHPLVIRIDFIKNKINKLYSKRGIDNGSIQET